MISSPSSWEAASTRSAICAGCSRARRRWVEPQARARDVADERLELRSTGRARPAPTGVPAEAPRQQPPEPRRRLGSIPATRQTPSCRSARPRRATHQTGGVDVDQAVAEHVGAQQHLAGAALELRQVELRRRGARGGRPRAARCGRRGRTARGRRCGPSGRSRAGARRARRAARRRPRLARASPPTNPAADSRPRRRDARPHRTCPAQRLSHRSPAPVRAPPARRDPALPDARRAGWRAAATRARWPAGTAWRRRRATAFRSSPPCSSAASLGREQL